MAVFIGRIQEMKQLEALSKLPTAQLIVLKGRRRIGKTRLLQEFGSRCEHSPAQRGAAVP